MPTISATQRPWKVLDARGNILASRELTAHRAKRKALQAYRGASAGRTQADWAYSTGSPDATLIPERMQLIYRIRERLRNDPVMRGCLQKVLDSVIGPQGFTVQSNLDHERLGISEEQARAIERDIDFEWEQWQKECDYAGNPARGFHFNAILSLLYSTRLTSGETLVIPRYVRRSWARFSFCLQLVAPDRIMTPNATRAMSNLLMPRGSEDIRDGVKIGRRGEILGVYVARTHPGSYRLMTDDWQVDFIPAYNQKTRRANFWHRYKQYQAEATRGEPAFAACLSGFKALGDYVTDELTRAHMTTMFGLAVYREEPFDPDTEGLKDSIREAGDYYEKLETQQEWYPGMLNYLEPGDRVDVVNPNIPGAQFGEFTDKLATWSAGPLPLSREQILNDHGKLSWSGGKISRDEAEKAVEREQEDVMHEYIAPPRERVIEEAWLRGRLSLPGFEDPSKRALYYSYAFFPPKRPYLEPVKEASGAEKRLAIGTSSLTLECAKQGYSMRTVLLQRAREKQEFEKLGLPLPAYLQDNPVVVDSPMDDNENDNQGQDNEATGDASA